MATDDELEVHRSLRDAQSRYIYFLLGVAGAAIAFAVTQSRDLALSWSQVPLGGAVLAWGMSFYAGCRNINWSTSALRTNAALLDVKAGRHEVTGTHPEKIAIGVETLHNIFENQSNHANRWWRLQFAFLVSGAVLYVAWHILEMYLKAAAA